METQGDHMTDNFEEFSLDSLELEGDEDLDDECNVNKENRLPASELRHCGDGAETKVRFCIFEYTIIIISRPLSLSELIPYLISLVLTHLGMEASIYLFIIIAFLPYLRFLFNDQKFQLTNLFFAFQNLNNSDNSLHSQDNSTINQTYEKFLEATGLSQKSILTPTRMFSNHR